MSNLMILGAILGAFISVMLLWLGVKSAALRYPVLVLQVPENAENDFLFRAWCEANQFVKQDNGIYRKGKGWLTSATEIGFKNNAMFIQECVHFLFFEVRFALNAPILIGRPIRQHKIKQLNKLLKHWDIEPVELGK